MDLPRDYTKAKKFRHAQGGSFMDSSSRLLKLSSFERTRVWVDEGYRNAVQNPPLVLVL